jgi:hypothetical protein
MKSLERFLIFENRIVTSINSLKQNVRLGALKFLDVSQNFVNFEETDEGVSIKDVYYYEKGVSRNYSSILATDMKDIEDIEDYLEEEAQDVLYDLNLTTTDLKGNQKTFRMKVSDQQQNPLHSVNSFAELLQDASEGDKLFKVKSKS